MQLLDLIEAFQHQAQAGDCVPFPRTGYETAAPLDADLAYRPVPDPRDGSLLQDPDFTLPSTAGPVQWSLFYDSRIAGQASEWGYSRKASFPLRLLTDDGTVVTVMHEDGRTCQYRLLANGQYAPVGDNFNALVLNNADPLTWTYEETLIESGLVYSFPSATYASLTYRGTPQGLRLSYGYDNQGRLRSVQEPAGRFVTLGYVANLTTVMYVQDWADRRNTLTYDAAGDLVEVQGPTGCLTQYEYDAEHRLTGITDPEGYATTYTYDEQGRVASRSVAGALGQYTYLKDESGVLTMTYANPMGEIWTLTTSRNGNPMGCVDPLGGVETYIYRNYRPVTSQNALGNIWSYVHDGNGMITGTQDPVGNVTTFVRDYTANIIAIVDEKASAVTFTFGSTPQHRRPITGTDPSGHITSFYYQDDGLISRVEASLPITYVWDRHARLVAIVGQLGQALTNTFDDADNIITTRDPLGIVRTFSRDSAGRPIARIQPSGSIFSLIFDARGVLTAYVEPTGSRVTMQVDSASNITKRTDSEGLVLTTTYNLNSLPVSLADPLGVRCTISYDKRGLMSQVTDSTGNTATNLYDAAYNLIARINPLGGMTSFSYDKKGRLLQQTDQAGFNVTHFFDPANNRNGQVDQLGYYWTNTCDRSGLSASEMYPDGTIRTYSYSSERRLDHVLEWDGGRITFQYDSAGRCEKVVHVDNTIDTISYDLAGRVASCNSNTYTYDLNGRLIALVIANGQRTTFSRDANGRIVSIAFAVGTIRTVTYSKNGLTTRVVDDQGVTTSVYNARKQLTSFIDEDAYPFTFGFNPRGKCNSITLPDETLTFSYDARGHLTSERSSAFPVGGVITYINEARGLLVATLSWQGTTTFHYDPRRRLTMTVDIDGTVETFAYSSSNLPLP